MFKRLFKRDHASAVHRCVQDLSRKEGAVDGKTRRLFWQYNGPDYLRQWLQMFEPHADEIAAAGTHEAEGFEQKRLELRAVIEALEHIPTDRYSLDDPDSLRCLVLRCIGAYVSDGPTLTFNEELDIYQQVLAQRGLSPRMTH